MKVSINWLKELVTLKVSLEEIIRLLPLRTVGLKEVSQDSFELDMKGYNRADLLSMRGVAYEIAAITNSEVSFTENSDYVWKNAELSEVATEVEDANLAPVYCLAKIEGLKVEKSPADWVKKLNDSGMRTVNNIADVTNLIMLEYGQPLHSFDADTVKNGKIIVRTAKTGEEITTLDNKKRTLETTDLLITDPEKALGIAGVMGGKNSEVSDSTTTILLEAAIFDPINLRNTATRLNLRSEASRRFQHGLTKKRCLQAFNAAIKMYQDLGGKLTGITLIGNLEDKPRTIELSLEKINSLIGVDIPTSEAESSLNKLGFKLASQHLEGEEMRLHLRGGINWEVTPPYWRLDVNIAEDVIEEIARMYGYEKIPAKPLSTNIPTTTQNPIFDLIESLKQALVGLGLTEVQTYSFYSTAVIVNCQLSIVNLIKLLNPMSSETEYLRDNLWPNLLEVTSRNIRNGIKDVAIFEIGKAYSPQEGDMPKESYHLAIALSNGTSNPINELSVIARSIATKQSSPDNNPTKIASLIARNDDSTTKNLFHPTRHTNEMAEVHPRIVNKFGIDQRVAVLEINLTSSQ